jgi:hypothetical protein
LYLHLGIEGYELHALDDEDRIIGSLRSKAEHVAHLGGKPRPCGADRRRFQALLEAGDSVRLIKAILESDEKLLRQLLASHSPR